MAALGDYYYAYERRKAENVPSYVKATPTDREVSLAHLTSKYLAQERARAANEATRVEAQRIGAENQFRQDVMDDRNTQLNAAAGISLANLGLTGYQGYKDLQRQNVLDAQRQQYYKRMDEMVTLQLDDLRNRARLFKGMGNFFKYGQGEYP